MSKTSSGRFGEDIAAKFLSRNGYKILTRNFHSHFGEIDIVATKDDCLVFVEVKTRWSISFGLPEEAVGHKKLQAIKQTGQYFRSTHNKLPESERIDVVALELNSDRSVKRLEIIENASF